METDKDKDPFKRGQKIKSFPFTWVMLKLGLKFPTDAQQGRYFRALARFGLEGADPEGLDASEVALFETVKEWLGGVRLERLAKAENGAKGGQAPKNPASYRGNKNAQKHPRQEASPYSYANPDEERKLWKQNKKEEAARNDKLEAGKTWEERATDFKKLFTFWAQTEPAKLALDGQDFKATPALRSTEWQEEILRNVGKWSETPEGQAAIKNATAANPLRLRPIVEKIVEEIDCEACELPPLPQVAPFEDLAASMRLQFAENLGLPKDLLTFTGKDFETLEEKLQNGALVKEALLRARSGNFSRFAEWQRARQEALETKKPKNLLPLLANIFKGIEEGFGGASKEGPAHPPQNSIQAEKGSARKQQNPVFAAASLRRKFARALDVPESGIEFDKKAFERCKERLEAPNALRRLLRQAKEETGAGKEELRKCVFDGGKMLLEAYFLTLWEYEAAFVKAQTAEEREAAREAARGRFSIAKPHTQSKTK